MKIKLPGFLSAVILGCAAFPAISVAQPKTEVRQTQSTPLTAEIKAAVLAQISEILAKSAFVEGVDFGKWPEYYAASKDAISKAETPDAFVQQLNEAFKRFGASHIALSSPKTAAQRIEQKVIGIGIQYEFVPEGALVEFVFPGGGASMAKVESGDIIVEANGKKPTEQTDILGPEGSTLHIKLKRFDGSVQEAGAVRKSFSSVIPETLTWPKTDVALLKIHTFDTGYDSENVKTLMAQAMKAKLLILDLRTNSGGLINKMRELAGTLLPEGVAMGTFVDRQSVEQYKTATHKDGKDIFDFANWQVKKVRPIASEKVFEGKIAVLTSARTASASEMLTAALRDLRGAKVIGVKSAGKMLGSRFAELAGGFEILYPYLDYVTMRGLRLEGNGIKPDIEAAAPRTSKEEDKGLAEALKWWENRKSVSTRIPTCTSLATWIE